MKSKSKHITHPQFSENPELQNLFVKVREHQLNDGYCKRVSLYRKIEAIAREQNAEKEIVHILSVFARYYIDHQQYKKAIECIYEALPIATKHKMNSRISNMYNWLAGIRFYLGDYSNALDFFQAEVDHNIKSGLEEHCFVAYNIMGNIYSDIDDLDTAEIFFSKAKALIDKYPDFMDVQNSTVHLNTSLIVLKIGKEQYEEAKQLSFKSIELAKKVNDKRLLPNLYCALALIAYDTKKYDEGLQYAYKANKYLSKNDFDNALNIHRVVALNYLKKGNKRQASLAFKRSIEYFNKVPNLTLLKIETLNKASELFDSTNAKKDLMMVEKILKETESSYQTLQMRLAIRAEQLISFTNQLAPSETNQANRKVDFHAIGIGKISIVIQDIYACQTHQNTAGKNVSLLYVKSKDDYYRIPSALTSILAMINDKSFIWISRNCFINKNYIKDWDEVAQRGIVNVQDRVFEISRRKRKELANNHNKIQKV